ncbi:MAG: VCBS repeat-containing protein, partial [Candidatus Kapaibacterium sp.]
MLMPRAFLTHLRSSYFMTCMILSSLFRIVRVRQVVKFLTLICLMFFCAFSLRAQSNAPLTNFPTFNGAVSSIAISGTTIYIGGAFTQATDAPANGGGTVTRNRLAAIDMTTGALLPWDPNANNNVGVVTVNGSTVYVGGGFTNVGGQPRLRIAALDAATGLATAWNPGSASISSVNAIAVSGAMVYVGGVFTAIGGQPRSNIAAIIAAGAGLATPWNPNADADVTTLLVNGTTVYVGGVFANIGGQPRNRIAALDAGTGLATMWNPTANNTVLCMALSGTTLYVGGDFTNIGGFGRIRIAALNTLVNTNNATLWNPTATGSVSSIAISGTTVYVCGTFPNAGSFPRNNIAALDATINTGNATAWNPNADAGASAIAVSGSNVFVGGAFANVNATPRAGFAAFGPPASPLVTPATLAPLRHASAAGASANINIEFDQTMNTGTYSASKLFVHGNMRGKRTNGAYTTIPATTVNFPATPARLPNEIVSVTVTNATSAAGANNRPFVYQFRTAVPTGPDPGTFPNGLPGSPFASGAGSYSVELGDFLDNDGDLDMAVANYSANTVLLYQNNPTGTFTLVRTLTAGFHARDVTLGDFNNDGWLDIATANIDANSISVFISAAGTLPMTATQTLTTGNLPPGIAVGDVNGDGWLDIITANNNGGAAGSISVFLNNGAGTFLARNDYPTSGNGTQELAIGDMDNDGDLDVVTANAASSTISVLLNNGLGVFSVFGTPLGTGGATPVAIALVDLNNDGNLDVFTANNGGNSVTQARGNGAGGLTVWTTYINIISPYGLAIGDVDGVNGPDVITTSSSDNTINVLPGDGGGGFLGGSTWSQGTPAVNGWAAALGDVDGDGDLDLATSSNGVAVLRNMPVMNVQNNVTPFTATVFVSPARNVNNAAPTTNITIPFAQTLNAPSVNAANFRVFGGMTGLRRVADGTTFGAGGATATINPGVDFLRGEQVWVTVTNAQSTAPDLALTRPFVYGFRVIAAGTGTGNFIDARRYPTGAQPWNTVTGQFDNVAGVDFAVANTGAGTITVHRNDGTGNFPPGLPNTVTVTVGSSPIGLETGDFDNDSDTDIIVVCQGSVWFVRNNNDGTYTPSSVITSAYARLYAAVTDFNADGNLDIVFGNNCCAGMPGAQVYFGTGAGAFTFSQTITTPGGGYVPVKTADMDGDGDMDIVYGFDGGGVGIRVYNNDGTGKFDTGTQVATADLYNMQVGDLNNDNRPDIVYTTISGSTQNVNVMLRTAPFTAYNFTTTSIAVPSAISPATQLADIDADGDLDILAVRSANTGGLGHAVVTLQNTGVNSGAFTVFATSPLVGFSGNNAVNGLFAFSAADFDNDGDLDLAIPKAPDNQVAVVLNQAPPLLVTGTPAMNASNVSPTASITPAFNLGVTAATTTLTGPIRVYGSQSAGRNRTGGGSWGGSIFTPNTLPTLTNRFFPGEKVDIVISSAANVGVGLTPLAQGTTWQFTVQAPTMTPGTFVVGNSYAISGSNTFTTTLGDFDGNGTLDAATANNAGNSTSVLYGTGVGTFNNQVAPSPYTLSAIPYTGATGDFNNDGRADLAFGHFTAAAVRVMLSIGATFNPSVNYPTNGANGRITVADFNGDGNQDIAVKRNNTNGVDMLFGNGDGTFQSVMQVSTINGDGIGSGDFNNDGYIDLIVSYNAGSTPSNSVQCLLNDGTGTRFTGLGTFSAGGVDTHTISVADFDGNGNLDVAVSNWGTNNVAIFRGNGDGTFQAADAYSTGAGTGPRSIVAGDFNGDGRMDIAAAGFGNNTLCILLRNAAAYTAGSAFASVAQYATPFTNPHGIAAGDVDGDGDIDIVVNCFGAAQMTVFLNAVPFNVQNNGPVTFTPPLTLPTFNTMNAALTTNINIPFSANVNPTTVNAANFRVHGTLRGMRTATPGVGPANTATLTGITSSFLPNERVFVTVTNAQSTPGGISTRPFVMSFRAASGLMPGAFHHTTAVPSAAAKRVVYGHFNADAFIDMAVSGSGGIELFTGAANGEFTSTGMIAGSAGTGYFALATADMDNNNTLDIIGGYNDATRTVRVFTNSGAGVFTALTPLTGIGPMAANNINDLAVADFNADGLMDVAAVCGGAVANGNYAVLRNTGGGVLAAQQTASSPNIYGVDVGDIDGDGDIDIAYTRWSAGEIFTLINDGRSNFYAGQTLVFGAEARSVRLGDVNNDGRLDLVVVQGGPSNLHIFLNSGMATTYPAVPSQTVAFGAWGTDVQLFDADGDNFLDAVATEDVGGRLVFFKNNAGTFAAPTPIYGFPNLLYLAAADIDNDGDVDLAATANNGSVHVLKYGLQPTISSVIPTRNGNGSGNPNIAGVGAPVTVNFLAPQTITTNSYSVPPAQQLFQVHGGFTGSRTRASGFGAPNGSYSGSPSSMVFTPSANFRVGELVSVSVTNASSSVATPNNSVGIRTRPFVFDYRVAAAGPGVGTFVQTQVVSGGGGNTRAVAVGDFDNMNGLDVVMVNQSGPNNIRLLTNNGSGSFTAQAAIPTGGNPSFPVVRDFDNDGNVDVIVSSLGTGTAAIFRNNPAGILTNVGSVSGLTGLDHIAAADFNGDGLMDIVASCGTNIRIAQNTGGLSFATPVSIAAGASTFGCATGDFDNDGDMDVVYCRNDNNVGILVNDGTGTFSATPFTVNVGSAQGFASVGDLDNDGDLDIVVSNTGGSTAMTILENTTSGGVLSFAAPINRATAAGNGDVVVADFNADGSLDIASILDATARIFMNTGTGALSGRFPVAPNSSTPLGGTNSFSGAAGDWDNDGDIDLVSANHTTGNASILFNQLPPTVFYYQSGDAGLPANWNSLPGGGGSPAVAFTSPATDFYVGVAGAVTATVNTSFAIGPFVSLHVTSPSVLAVSNGITITNNGFLNVSGATVAGATLRLIGTG